MPKHYQQNNEISFIKELLGQVGQGRMINRQAGLGQERVWLGQARLSYTRLGQVRLGQVRLGQVRLGQVRLGQARLGQVRLGQIRLGQVSYRSLLMKKFLILPRHYRLCLISDIAVDTYTKNLTIAHITQTYIENKYSGRSLIGSPIIESVG